jgi:thiosulfate dehydrogenase
MPSRLGWFVLGIFTAMAGLFCGAYLFVRAGGVPMDTTARPLPLEGAVARLALRASLGNAADDDDPLPVTDANMLAGLRVYEDHCAVCHGLPGRSRTAIARGMFPPPPPLFDANSMVTDDPEGVTHWKVTHGIRLSGMPGFGRTLSDTQRWQLTMLLAHADTLSPEVRSAIGRARGEAEPAPR